MTAWLGLSPEAQRINAAAHASARARANEPAFGPSVIGLQIVGEIDDRMVKQVERALAAKPSASEISLVINSPGGSVAASKAIYSALRSHGALISARAVNGCGSAATRVLLAADYREATSDCRFLLHQVAVDPGGERWTAATHARIAATIREFNAEAALFYAVRTGRAQARFAAEMRTESPMTAQRARDEFNLIHAVLP